MSRMLRGTGRCLLSGARNGHTILTILDSGAGEARVTTAQPHGLNQDDNIVVSGTSNAVYNAPWVVNAVSTTQFDLQGAGWSGDSAGGRWD
jgi:hypothetical protein